MIFLKYTRYLFFFFFDVQLSINSLYVHLKNDELFFFVKKKLFQEVALGKRVGFYKLGKELGAGNFSKVKLGVHLLTEGEISKNNYTIHCFFFYYQNAVQIHINITTFFFFFIFLYNFVSFYYKNLHLSHFAYLTL